MKIKELPSGTVIELCRYLDIQGDGQRNWKQLVTRIPGRVYTIYDINAFAIAGQRAHTSPAEEVIKDLITLGVTVDSLYRILHTMDARQCMDTLKEHVSQEVIDEVEALRQSELERSAYQPQTIIGSDPGDPLRDADVHPVYGPLPNHPPPSTSSQNHHYPGPGQNHYSAHPPPPAHSHVAQGQHYHTVSAGADQLAHAGVGGLGRQPVSSQRIGAAPESSHQTSRYSSQTTGSKSVTNQASSGSFTSSSGRVNSGAHHPLPPFLLSHSNSPYQNGNGTTTGATVVTTYYSHNHVPPLAKTVTAGVNYPSQSKGYPPNSYAHLSSSSGSSSNQPSLKGSSPSYYHHNHRQAVTTGSSTQSPFTPGWPSTYGSSSSPEQSSYSYASYHNTPLSNGGVQPPVVPHPLRSHMTTPSYGEGSRQSYSGSSSSDHTHFRSVSSSTVDERSKDEEKNVAPNILKFKYSELSEATDGFVKGIVGLGSFGTVFRAKIRGNGPYAVKKLYTEREMGGGVFYEPLYRETFTQELNMLTKYHHRNILSLVAYSNDGPTPCLVYEYMENGSLADCLQGKRNVSLLWNLRLTIANRIADALHFLHTVNKPKSVLVHGDVKSANILLDAHCVPKLSDFGLARECSSTASNQSTTINTKSDIIMGTMAYLAPEFIRNKKFKPSADVYSFGVVLLELYTGQLALSDDPAHHERVLTTRLATLIDDGSENHHDEVMMMADAKAFWPHQTGLEMFDIATVCLRHKPRLRPPMEQVLDQLHLISPQQSPSPQVVGSPQTFGQNYESPYAGSWH